MRFEKTVAVSLIILCLTTGGRSNSVPENGTQGGAGLNKKFRLCGAQLTNLIELLCNGSYYSSPTKRSVSLGVADECCLQSCTMRQMLNYCRKVDPNKISDIVWDFIGERTLNTLEEDKKSEETPIYLGSNQTTKKDETTGTEVRISKNGKKRGKKGRKKKKKSFKRKCAFKSFGQYLLKLNRNDRVRNKIAKRNNFMGKSWPSIQVGTISPELEDFGGQPIVVMNNNNPNSI